MPPYSLILFPTPASLQNNTWHIPIHGCLYRPAEISRLRRLALRVVKRLVHLRFPKANLSSPLFHQRANAFLADNVRGTRITLQCHNLTFRLKRTHANGHFHDILKLPINPVDKLSNSSPQWLPLSAPQSLNPIATSATGQTLLLPPTGLSVISDIDDTIKITEVLNRKQMLNNTFLKQFSTVPDMAALYQRWHTTHHAAFHYVSASPWHLFPFLDEFLSAQNFPAGTFHLRDFRLMPRNLLSTIRPAPRVKKKHILSLLTQFPQRRFILIGDSGESDPTLYASLYQKFPAQIQNIYIRNITNDPPTSPRWQQQFARVPSSRWQVFNDPSHIFL